MSAPVPLLIISGSMGSGKTVVLAEVSILLAQANVAFGAIDLDWLSISFPSDAESRERMMFDNLAAVWPIYAAAGADRLVVARPVVERAQLQRFREAIPGAEPVVCQLEASIETMEERLRVRETGLLQELGNRPGPFADMLRRAHAEDYTVDNGAGRHITDVAREVLTRPGWL